MVIQAQFAPDFLNEVCLYLRAHGHEKTYGALLVYHHPHFAKAILKRALKRIGPQR